MGTSVVKRAHTFDDDEMVTVPDYDDLQLKADIDYVKRKFSDADKGLSDLASRLSKLDNSLEDLTSIVHTKIDHRILTEALQKVLISENLEQARAAIAELLEANLVAIQKEGGELAATIRTETAAFRQVVDRAHDELARLLAPVSLQLQELMVKAQERSGRSKDESEWLQVRRELEVLKAAVAKKNENSFLCGIHRLFFLFRRLFPKFVSKNPIGGPPGKT